jgi:hypothetical protein
VIELGCVLAKKCKQSNISSGYDNWACTAISLTGEEESQYHKPISWKCGEWNNTLHELQSKSIIDFSFSWAKCMIVCDIDCLCIVLQFSG